MKYSAISAKQVDGVVSICHFKENSNQLKEYAMETEELPFPIFKNIN